MEISWLAAPTSTKISWISATFFPFVEHLRKPVLAVILSANFGLVTLFNSVNILPGVNFSTKAWRAKLKRDVFWSQLGNVGMLQVYLQFN